MKWRPGRKEWFVSSLWMHPNWKWHKLTQGTDLFCIMQNAVNKIKILAKGRVLQEVVVFTDRLEK